MICIIIATVCTVCLELVHVIDMAKNETLDVVVKKAIEYCETKKWYWAEVCKVIVNEWLPWIVKHCKFGMDPWHICTHIHFCSAGELPDGGGSDDDTIDSDSSFDGSGSSVQGIRESPAS